MPYRTLLVHVDDAASADARYRHAIGLARHFDAHLIGLAASGLSRTLYPTLPREQEDPTLALHLGYLREQAQAGLTRFAWLCEEAKLAAFTPELVDDEIAAALSLRACVADLTVLSQRDPEAGGEDIAAEVVLHTPGPVLLLPFTHAASHDPELPRHVLVAWDASREAARALHAALPLLQGAQSVSVAIIDTVPASRVSADARRADPLAFLARHGVQAELLTRTAEAPRLPHFRHPVGETLISLAGELGAELMVMGAYAHSRVREMLLGGVTHTVFRNLAIPVLMAH